MIASVTISLLIAEASFRFFEIGYGNSPVSRSAVYHHIHPSNYAFLMHDPNGEYGGYHVYYDGSGFRVPDRTTSNSLDENRAQGIVFLGDSFTEGNQVTFEDTFVSLVGSSLGVPVTNLGVSSYSPIIYRLQALNILNAHRVDTVIMQIFKNDFANDLSYLNDAVFVGNNVAAIYGGENSLLVQLLRRSYLARFLRKSQLLIGKIFQSETLKSINNKYDYEQNVTEGELANTVSIISQINNILNKQGKTLFVFLVPSKSLTKTGSCCGDDELYSLFYRALDEVGIATIDVADGFKNSEEQENLFFDIDTHLTTLGHAVVANSILKHFTKK